MPAAEIGEWLTCRWMTMSHRKGGGRMMGIQDSVLIILMFILKLI